MMKVINTYQHSVQRVLHYATAELSVKKQEPVHAVA
jgi:hypothetical protein